jgi:hypothetical protein
MRIIHGKRSSKVLAFAVGGILLIASTGEAGVITFDDLPAFAPIPNGYQSLNWNSLYVFYGPAGRQPYGTAAMSGLYAGLVSPPNDVENYSGSPGGSPASFSSTTPFTLTSAYFTGAWNDNLVILVQGLSGTTVVDSIILVLGPATAPTFEGFYWSGLTEVDFSSYGGFPNQPYAPYGDGTEFVMDNLTINGTQTPEPSTALLVATGFGIVLVRRKRLSWLTRVEIKRFFH